MGATGNPLKLGGFSWPGSNLGPSGPGREQDAPCGRAPSPTLPPPARPWPRPWRSRSRPTSHLWPWRPEQRCELEQEPEAEREPRAAPPGCACHGWSLSASRGQQSPSLAGKRLRPGLGHLGTQKPGRNLSQCPAPSLPSHHTHTRTPPVTLLQRARGG